MKIKEWVIERTGQYFIPEFYGIDRDKDYVQCRDGSGLPYFVDKGRFDGLTPVYINKVQKSELLHQRQDYLTSYEALVDCETRKVYLIVYD